MRPYSRHQCRTQCSHSMGDRDSKHIPILQEDHKHMLKVLQHRHSMILSDTTVRALRVGFPFPLILAMI
jgi:hypothetical protein